MKIVIAHPNKDYADHLYALMHTYEEDAETHLCSDVYEAFKPVSDGREWRRPAL
jgi:hypothetical protein